MTRSATSVNQPLTGCEVIKPSRRKIKPKPENVEASIASANVLVRAGKSRLGEDVLQEILLWSAEGMPPEKIQKRLIKKYDKMVTLPTIKKYVQEFTPRIQEIAREWDREFITKGLARKSIRLKKMMKVADGIEDILFPDDGDSLNLEAGGTRLITEYRDTLKQIGVETGDIQEGNVDQLFINLSDEQLKKLAADTFAKNKDIAVILAEQAGVRPVVPEIIRELDAASAVDLANAINITPEPIQDEQGVEGERD